MIPTNSTISYKATPIVTYAIIAACTIAFLYQLSLPAGDLQKLFAAHALVPARYTDSAWALKNGLTPYDVSPFLTCLFLHGGILHLAANMWALWVFGPALEDRLGPTRFIVVYLVSALLAGIAHVVFNFASPVPTIGASGAIAGVIAAYVRRFPYAWINVLQPIGIFPVFLYLPAIVFAGLWFLTQIASGIGALLLPAGAGGIAWWAHVGGFVTGWLLQKWLAKPTDPAEEQQAAIQSFFWPWEMWSRWMNWWWKPRR